MTPDPSQPNKDPEIRAHDCTIIVVSAAVLFLASVALHYSNMTELRTLSVLLFIASLVCGAWAFSKVKPLRLLSNLFVNFGLIARPTQEHVVRHVAAVSAALAIHVVISLHHTGMLPPDQYVFRTLIAMAFLFAPFMYLESIAERHATSRPRTPILLLHRQTCILLIFIAFTFDLLNAIPVRSAGNQMLTGWPYSDSYEYELMDHFYKSPQQREQHSHLQNLNLAIALATIVASAALSEYILRRSSKKPAPSENTA